MSLPVNIVTLVSGQFGTVCLPVFVAFMLEGFVFSLYIRGLFLESTPFLISCGIIY